MEQRNLNLVDRRLNTDSLTIMLTYQCQMACRYCFLDRHYPDMSEGVIKRSIDLLFTSSSQEVELQFFGGEPLLKFNLIKKAITYAENKSRQINKKIKYLITTNGLLLDEKKLAYLKKYNVTIMLSLDGSKYTQIKNRPLIEKTKAGYFDGLIRNLRKLLDTKLNYFINLTFLPEDLPDLKDNVNYLIGLGIKEIQLSYAIGGDFKQENLPVYIGALKEIIKIVKNKNVRLRNIYNDIEPVFASTQINVATSGDIYLGCAFIIKKTFADSNKLFYFGRLQDIQNISLLKRTRKEQLAFLMAKSDKLHSRLKNNIYFGVGVYVFWLNYTLLDKYASFTEESLGNQSVSYLYNDKMMLILTYQCQMACHCCFLDRHHPDMSEEVLRWSIDLLLTSPSKEIELQFVGGDPLLRFDLIKKAIAYSQDKSKQINKSVKYLIITNGLLLDEKKLEYLKDYNVYFLLSIDGDMATQLANRPPVNSNKQYHFDAILNALRLLSRMQFDSSVNMVIGPFNISSTYKNALFLFKEGVKKMRFSYELGAPWKDSEIADYFIEFYRIMERIKGRTDIEIINQEADDEPHLIFPALTVDYDGKIYCGCTIPLERIFSRLRRVNLVGNVMLNKNLVEIKKRKIDVIRDMAKVYSGHALEKVILNNLALGEVSHAFFKGLFIKEKQERTLRMVTPKVVNSVVLMCTYACQLACDYCYIKQSGLSMSYAVLKKAVDFLLTSQASDCQLRFWGGEPLLQWPLIQRGIELGEEKAKGKGKKIRFMITTNGILLDDKKIGYLKKHHVEVMFSFDGDLEANKRHRLVRGREVFYDKILANLKLVINSGIPHFVNVVVAPSTAGDLLENLVFLKGLGAARVQLCYHNAVFWTKEETEILINQLKGFILLYNDYKFLMNFVNDCEPTMLGHEIVVDTDGKIYFDGAMFMEKVFPHLRKPYFLGKVDEINSVDSLYCSRRSFYYIFKNACRSKEAKRVFSNNIEMGLKIDSLVNGFYNQSISSNEHPLLIPVIKGDFFTQRKLLAKFKINSLFLYLDGPCLNNCLFCKHKGGEKFSDMLKVEFKLKTNQKIKAKKLCIIGNEPLLHPDIEEIIGLSKRCGFKEIEVMTSGEYLCDMDLVCKLVERGVSSFSLPLFAAKESVHDYIVGREGSFIQTMQGIRNALIYKAKVYVHTNLIRQNLNYIKDLEDFVRKEQLGTSFVVLPIRPKTANLSFAELMPSYSQIISELKGINSLLGFPLCVINKAQEKLFKGEEDISDAMKLYVLDQRFSKLKICQGCFYFDRCLGLFKEYLLIYGSRGIAPFKK